MKRIFSLKYFFEKLIHENMILRKIILVCLVGYKKVTHLIVPYIWLSITFLKKLFKIPFIPLIKENILSHFIHYSKGTFEKKIPISNTWESWKPMSHLEFFFHEMCKFYFLRNATFQSLFFKNFNKTRGILSFSYWLYFPSLLANQISHLYLRLLFCIMSY